VVLPQVIKAKTLKSQIVPFDSKRRLNRITDLSSGKVKLAILWFFVVVTNLAIVTLTFVAPGVIDDIRGGHVLGAQITPDLLLLIALTYFLVPAVLAVSSILLKDSINRWINLAGGILYVVFVLNELVSNIIKMSYIFGMFLQASTIFVLVLIIWYSWNLTGKP